MIAIIAFLVESLEEQAQRVRSMTVLRAILIILSLVMLSYAPMIGGLLIWAAAIRYLPLALREREQRQCIARAVQSCCPSRRSRQ